MKPVCESCGRVVAYVRVSTKEAVCGKCGHIGKPLAGGLGGTLAFTKSEATILGLVLKTILAAPVGYSTLHKTLRSVTHYIGPLDAVLGRMRDKGLMQKGYTSQVIYWNVAWRDGLAADVEKRGLEEVVREILTPGPPLFTEDEKEA